MDNNNSTLSSYYNIEKIASVIHAKIIGENSFDSHIYWLLTDSRSLSTIEHTLFFALKTANGDGHQYIEELYVKGVRYFVVEKYEEVFKHYPKATFLVVNNSLVALQTLAKEHRHLFSIPIVGITGSKGKTIVKEWVRQIFLDWKNITCSPRSFNSQIGLPLSLWLLNTSTEIGVFEAGISLPQEMQKLEEILQPTIGIFTNIDNEHQDAFNTIEEKCKEKMELFKHSNVLIYNQDNSLIETCVKNNLPTSVKLLSWSKTNANAFLWIKNISQTFQETLITYSYLGYEGEIKLNFIADHLVENAIHCLALCLYFKMPQQRIYNKLLKLQDLTTKIEVRQGYNNNIIIQDYYPLDLKSLEIALDFMFRRPNIQSLTPVVILNLQEKTNEDIQQFEKVLTSHQITHCLTFGEKFLTAITKAVHFKDINELLNSHVFTQLSNSLILVKGAKVKTICDYLSQKVHDTTLEINLKALVDNLNYYKSHLKPNVKMVCMVKANAYGMGAVEIAKTLQEHKVDYLAVAVADEGVELRKAGITANIMVMNPNKTAFRTIFQYRLEPEIYSFKLLQECIEEAEKYGITSYPIHLKINTGMLRLGFSPQKDMPLLIQTLKQQTALIPRSVFSHFVGSDDVKFDNFTHQQQQSFLAASSQLQEAFPYPILKHICNSAAILRFPEYQHNMVRLGLGLYGINPIDNQMLSPIASLQTTILQIHSACEGESVGYSRNTILNQDSKIATLPIGYADGLNRKMGNRKGYCLVNGQQAPYVGNICMDVCMIDVTNIDCKEGDTAIIFGKDLPPTFLAKWIDTIPYEILTNLSERIKKIYFQE